MLFPCREIAQSRRYLIQGTDTSDGVQLKIQNPKQTRNTQKTNKDALPRRRLESKATRRDDSSTTVPKRKLTTFPSSLSPSPLHWGKAIIYSRRGPPFPVLGRSDIAGFSTIFPFSFPPLFLFFFLVIKLIKVYNPFFPSLFLLFYRCHLRVEGMKGKKRIPDLPFVAE